MDHSDGRTELGLQRAENSLRDCLKKRFLRHQRARDKRQRCIRQPDHQLSPAGSPQDAGIRYGFSGADNIVSRVTAIANGGLVHMVAHVTKLRTWHWVTLCVVGFLAILILWLAIAYGELPRIWSKHEHRKIRRAEVVVSYTSQDIPADPVNIRLIGDERSIKCAFSSGGWSLADPLSARSAIGIVGSVVLLRPYPEAPVSSLYFKDHLQDLAFERDEGRSAHRRHHVRLWKAAQNQWLGAATYDRGVGFALFTLQITHHIGPNVDAERDSLGRMLENHGARFSGSSPSNIPPGRKQRNGGGDPYFTDGMIKTFAVPPASC